MTRVEKAAERDPLGIGEPTEVGPGAFRKTRVVSGAVSVIIVIAVVTAILLALALGVIWIIPHLGPGL